MTDTQVTLKMIWWLYLIYAGFLIELHVKCGQRFIQYETLTDVKPFTSHFPESKQRRQTAESNTTTIKIYGKNLR